MHFSVAKLWQSKRVLECYVSDIPTHHRNQAAPDISPSLSSEYLSPPPFGYFQGPTGPPGSSGPPGSVGDPGERVSVSLDLIKTHYLSLLMYLYSTLSLNLSAHLSLSPSCRALLVKLVCPELTESLDLLEPQSCCLWDTLNFGCFIRIEYYLNGFKYEQCFSLMSALRCHRLLINILYNAVRSVHVQVISLYWLSFKYLYIGLSQI